MLMMKKWFWLTVFISLETSTILCAPKDNVSYKDDTNDVDTLDEPSGSITKDAAKKTVFSPGRKLHKGSEIGEVEMLVANKKPFLKECTGKRNVYTKDSIEQTRKKMSRNNSIQDNEEEDRVEEFDDNEDDKISDSNDDTDLFNDDTEESNSNDILSNMEERDLIEETPQKKKLNQKRGRKNGNYINAMDNLNLAEYGNEDSSAEVSGNSGNYYVEDLKTLNSGNNVETSVKNILASNDENSSVEDLESAKNVVNINSSPEDLEFSKSSLENNNGNDENTSNVELNDKLTNDANTSAEDLESNNLDGSSGNPKSSISNADSSESLLSNSADSSEGLQSNSADSSEGLQSNSADSSESLQSNSAESSESLQSNSADSSKSPQSNSVDSDEANNADSNDADAESSKSASSGDSLHKDPNTVPNDGNSIPENKELNNIVYSNRPEKDQVSNDDNLKEEESNSISQNVLSSFAEDNSENVESLNNIAYSGDSSNQDCGEYLNKDTLNKDTAVEEIVNPSSGKNVGSSMEENLTPEQNTTSQESSASSEETSNTLDQNLALCRQKRGSGCCATPAPCVPTIPASSSPRNRPPCGPKLIVVPAECTEEPPRCCPEKGGPGPTSFPGKKFVRRRRLRRNEKLLDVRFA